jgi:hypothetical protein
MNWSPKSVEVTPAFPFRPDWTVSARGAFAPALPAVDVVAATVSEPLETVGAAPAYPPAFWLDVLGQSPGPPPKDVMLKLNPEDEKTEFPPADALVNV